MILSRLSQAIRTQNWFAVTLEFVIVILGVVIGFQVNGWAEDRANQRAERAIIERLEGEFRSLVATGEAYLARSAQQQRLMARWIEAAEDPEPLDMDRLERLVLEFYAVENPDRIGEFSRLPESSLFTDPIGADRRPEVSVVFEQLVASGDLRLLRSEDLRNALTRRDAQRVQSLAAIQRNNASVNLATTQTFLEAVFQAGSPSPRAVLNSAMSEPEFAGSLRTFYGLRSYNDGWYETTHESTAAVLALLEEMAE